MPLLKPPYGRITAIDLNTGEHVWMVANADTPESIKNHPPLKGLDIPRTGTPEWSGILVTKALVFAGEGAASFAIAATLHGGGPMFHAFDKKPGDLVAEVKLPSNQNGIPITPAIADDIVAALRSGDADGEQRRLEALRQFEQRQRTMTAKLDRGYDDYVSGRISAEFWARKSQEWETELQDVHAERGRVAQPQRCLTATALQILDLELAKQAEFLYQTQLPPEQRRLLETVLSNCTFNCGTLCPTYSKPFDLLVQGNQTGNWRARQDSNLRPPA